MTSKQHQSFKALGLSEIEQGDNAQTSNRQATEQLLRQIFAKHKESQGTTKDLTQEVSKAFQLFQSDFSDLTGRRRENEKDKNIQERISSLQKRTSETLQVLKNCKENLNSVSILDTRAEQSEEFDFTPTSDTRSLDELTEEIRKVQNREPSRSSIAPIERPDIEEMKNATHELLNELQRISKCYDKITATPGNQKN